MTLEAVTYDIPLVVHMMNPVIEDTQKNIKFFRMNFILFDPPSFQLWIGKKKIFIEVDYGSAITNLETLKWEVHWNFLKINSPDLDVGKNKETIISILETICPFYGTGSRFDRYQGSQPDSIGSITINFEKAQWGGNR